MSEDSRFPLMKAMPIIVCVIITIIIATASSLMTGGANDRVSQAELELSKMRNQVTAQEAGFVNSSSSVVTEVIGLSAQKVSKDNEAASKFMDWVFTWDTAEGYNQIRSDLMSRYGCSPSSGFLTNFMPELVSNTDSDGNSYNLIDTLGYNMSYDSLDPIVCGIDGDTYSYFAVVNVYSTNKYGDEGFGKVAFEYAVDGNEDVRVIDAYTVSR